MTLKSNDPSEIVIIIVVIICIVIVGVLSEATHLNAAQKKLVGNKTLTSERELEFLTLACKAKSVCKTYPDVKQSCAEAGSIQKCIDIRMKGEDSSGCADDGKVSGFDDETMPGLAQCTAIKISQILH